jgi:hypothetical protein
VTTSSSIGNVPVVEPVAVMLALRACTLHAMMTRLHMVSEAVAADRSILHVIPLFQFDWAL